MAYHIISQPKWASLALCKSMCARVVVLCHPSCLALPVLLSPWGQSSPFSEENEIRKNGSDREWGCVMNYLCPPPFGVRLAWCFTVCTCVLRFWMSVTVASKINDFAVVGCMVLFILFYIFVISHLEYYKVLYKHQQVGVVRLQTICWVSIASRTRYNITHSVKVYFDLGVSLFILTLWHPVDTVTSVFL